VTSGRHKSAMVTDRWKFTANITLYGNSCFPFLPLESIQSHSPGLYTLYKKPPQFFCNVWHVLTTRQIMLISLSHRQPINIDCWVSQVTLCLV